jgi:hypothetical protein
MGATIRLAVRRRVPRTRRRTLMVDELLYVGVGGVDVFPATMRYRFATGQGVRPAYPRRCWHGAEALLPDTSDPRRRLYRCLARLTASHPPRGAPVVLVRAADPQVTQTIKRTNRPCFVLEAAFLYDGASSGPRGHHNRRPCQQDRPHRGHPIRRSSYHTR